MQVIYLPFGPDFDLLRYSLVICCVQFVENGVRWQQ